LPECPDKLFGSLGSLFRSQGPAARLL